MPRSNRAMAGIASLLGVLLVGFFGYLMVVKTDFSFTTIVGMVAGAALAIFQGKKLLGSSQNQEDDEDEEEWE